MIISLSQGMRAEVCKCSTWSLQTAAGTFNNVMYANGGVSDCVTGMCSQMTGDLSIMASQLKVNTLTGVTTAGSIVVTGEGNSTTTNLQQGLAKAWAVSVSGASPLDSFNISSVTDNSTGN